MDSKIFISSYKLCNEKEKEAEFFNSPDCKEMIKDLIDMVNYDIDLCTIKRLNL